MAWERSDAQVEEQRRRYRPETPAPPLRIREGQYYIVVTPSSAFTDIIQEGLRGMDGISECVPGRTGTMRPVLYLCLEQDQSESQAATDAVCAAIREKLLGLRGAFPSEIAELEVKMRE